MRKVLWNHLPEETAKSLKVAVTPLTSHLASSRIQMCSCKLFFHFFILFTKFTGNKTLKTKNVA